MFKGFSSAVGLAVALVLAPATALAQEELTSYPDCEREPSESDITAAKAAFQAGNVSFNEADYPRAILYWEDAYRRDCTKHQMLLNLARAYELHGHKKQAVLALETFLLREPSAQDKPQITRRIEVLKKQIDSEEAARAARPAEAPPAASPAAVPASQQPVAGSPEERPTASEGSRPLLPLFVAGAGAALVIAGAVVYFPAASDVDEYAQQCENSEDHDECPTEILEPANDARNKANLGGVIAGVGGAALIGGVVWYFLSPKQGGSASSAGTPAPKRVVVPALSSGFAGLAVSGEF